MGWLSRLFGGGSSLSADTSDGQKCSTSTPKSGTSDKIEHCQDGSTAFTQTKKTKKGKKNITYEYPPGDEK